MAKFLIVNLFLLLSLRLSFALIPLESLILGDLSDQYLQNEHPIKKIFSTKKDYENNYTNFINLYRGFLSEGKNLDNFCKIKPTASFSTKINRDQAVRSILSTIQYIGLDITSKVIPVYARKLDFSNSEWDNLEDRLINNYCSQNLTVISLKQLKKNLSYRFKNDIEASLPDIKNNTYFPQKINYINNDNKMIEQEFIQTVKLFRSFCSWNGNINDAKLLTPFINNPLVMAYILRKLSGNKISYDYKNDQFFFRSDPKSVHVACNNIICRKYNLVEFQKYYPRTIGSTNLHDDVKRVYCKHMRNYDFVTKNKSSIVYKWQIEQSFDDYNLQLAQFIALITKVPDFIVRSNRYSDAKKYFIFSSDRYWNSWATNQNILLNQNIYYEEPLSLEKVSRSIYFNKYIPEFKVMLDINMGEFDRSLHNVGKVKVSVNLNISKKYLKWIRKEWSAVNKSDNKKYEHLIMTFRNYVEGPIEKFKSKFTFSPWKGDLSRIIVLELLEQISLYKGKFFSEDLRKNVTIPIILGYGPFALKYINYEHNIKENLKQLDYSDYEYSD